MNKKTKIALILLSLAALSGCDTDSLSDSNDEQTTKKSATSVGIFPTAGVDIATNGGFEEWSETGEITGWDTIDTYGIAIAQNTEIFEEGTSSGAFTITNDKPDFRQNIEVVNGKTYTLSMSIYHTEGGLKTRLYLDTYTDLYSDESLVNEWQELSVEYTAIESKSIEIGMRFYEEDAFDGEEIVYIDNLKLVESGTAVAAPALLPPPSISDDSEALAAYYSSAEGKTGLELKTELYNIIKGHNSQDYNDLWTFMSTYSLDTYYENDNTILDIYSENPSTSDSYSFTPVTHQCGNYSEEGDCYNREHSFPKSWFDDDYPMYSDVHHIFATDGKVNGYRSNFPYGEVDEATFTSTNGSKLGSPISTLGYTGETVFEPIDEFKGDLARAYFYMATRYENVVDTWSINSENADAVLDGSQGLVFEPWVIEMMKEWHDNDPVSAKEQYRNDAAFMFQGNRNPFIDHPEYVNQIWAD